MHADKLNNSDRYLIFGNTYQYLGTRRNSAGALVFIFNAIHQKERKAVVPFQKIVDSNELKLYVKQVRA